MGAEAPPDERRRICAAFTALVGERGFPSTHLPLLAERAELDPVAFSRHFASLEDCFTAVWEAADLDLAASLETAYKETNGDWPQRLRASLEALLSFLDADVDRARLYVVEVVQVSEPMRARADAARARLALLIDRGREGAEDSVPPHIAQAVAGAIWYRLEGRLRNSGAAPLRDDLALMVYFAVLPFRGNQAARAELRRCPPVRK